MTPAMEWGLPSSISSEVKWMRAAASLLMRWFMMSICPSGLFFPERRYGRLTALMCFDSVIEEQSPFGAPNCVIEKT